MISSRASGQYPGRIVPAPALETLGTSQLTLCIRRHNNLSDRKPTAFISLTPDLIRALHLMFYIYNDQNKRQDLSHLPSEAHTRELYSLARFSNYMQSPDITQI